jgi:hypothetical protein
MNNADLSRNAVKSHLIASFQTLHRIRDELLELLEPGDHPPPTRRDFGADLVRLQEYLIDELRWLKSIDDQVQGNRLRLMVDPRLGYLRRYGAELGETMKTLNAAIKSPMKVTTYGRVQHVEAFMPLGVAILRILALEQEARRL